MSKRNWTLTCVFCLLALIGLLPACSNEGTAELPADVPEAVETELTRPPTSRPFPSSTLAPSDTATPDITPTLTIAVTTSSNGTVSHLPSGTSLTFRKLWMMDSEQGWALGGENREDTQLFRTADGGTTWQDVTPPEQVEASGLMDAAAFFLDDETGWFVYQRIPSPDGFLAPMVWRTDDGGESWVASEPLDVSGFMGFYGPSRIGFSDQLHGWLMLDLDAAMMHRYIAIYTTNDGGASWTRVVDPTSDAPIQTGDKTGLVMDVEGRGLMTRDLHGLTPEITVEITRDGGRTWESVVLDVPAVDSGVQQLCAAHSPALFSALSWRVGVSCVVFNDEGNTGDDPWLSGEAYLFRTEDGGITWERFDSPGGEQIYFDGDVVLSLGREIYRSDDGGLTWSYRRTVNWDAVFSFISPDTGWAAAYNQGESALVWTENGGETWQALYPVVR